MKPLPRVVLMLGLAVGVSMCAAPRPDPSATEDGATPDWLRLVGRATPEGWIGVFEWIPPAGSSSPHDERGYQTLTVDYAPLVAEADRSRFREYAFFAFDSFEEDGKTLWRPQATVQFPSGNWTESMLHPEWTQMNGSLEPQRYGFRNQSGFDLRPLRILILARAEVPIAFDVGLRPYPGQSIDDLEAGGREAPATPPSDPSAYEALPRLREASGFRLGVAQETVVGVRFTGFHTPTVEVEHAWDSTGTPTPSGRTRLLVSDHAGPGWTMLVVGFQKMVRIGEYRLDVDVRGRAHHSEGVLAQAYPALQPTGYRLEVPTVYVYREGPGRTMVNLDLVFVDRPDHHGFLYWHVVLDTPLSELLDGATYEGWSVRGRTAPASG